MDENRRLLRRLGIVVARGRARTYRLVSGSEEIATHLDEKRVASSEKTGTALHSPVERDREEHQGARLMQRAGSRAGRRNIAMANAMRKIRASSWSQRDRASVLPLAGVQGRNDTCSRKIMINVAPAWAPKHHHDQSGYRQFTSAS